VVINGFVIVNIRYFCAVALTLFANIYAANAHSAACIVSAENLTDTKTEYFASCNLPLKDCDPVSGKWYCSSEKVNRNSIASLHSAEQLSAPADVPTAYVAPSSAIEICIDTDGDGWGWNGVRSCSIESQSNSASTQTPDAITNPIQQAPGTCLDPDGDGWGWNGVRSCTIASQTANVNIQISEPTITEAQQTQNICIDSDGDGWGWNGTRSCKIATPITNTTAVDRIETTASQTNTANQPNASCSGGPYSPSNITDLVLVTGQSNVTGADTTVAAKLNRWGKVEEFLAPDTPHPRVFAWTVDGLNNNAGTGWKVATLNQSWHDHAPGIGGIARNNFAFHFAKEVAKRDPCKVVGFVMVSEGGKGISHWDNNATGWLEVKRHITEAMSAIERTSIDAILWHQGESDWIADGTCFTSEVCINNQPDYYPQKLYSRIANQAIPNLVGQSALIDRFRRQSWFSADKPFIAGETLKAPMNIHLNKLNTDNDRFTACISSDMKSGLGVREDDPHKNHYNASGLREIGVRYATQYLKMSN